MVKRTDTQQAYRRVAQNRIDAAGADGMIAAEMMGYFVKNWLRIK